MASDYTFRAKILSQKVTYLHKRKSIGLHSFLSTYFRQKKRKRRMSTNRLTPCNKRTMPLNNNTHSIRKLNRIFIMKNIFHFLY